MRVGLDLDGTVYDFDGRVHELYEDEFDRSLPRTVAYTDTLDSTHFGCMADLLQWYTESFGWQTARLFEGATQTMWHVPDFTCLTHRPTHAQYATFRVVQRDFNPGTRFWLTDRPKAEYADLFGIDLFIDDAPHEIYSFQDAGLDYVIFDQIWNRGIEGTRVHDWDELRSLFYDRGIIP